LTLKTKLFLPVVIVITLTAIVSMYFSKTAIENLMNLQIRQQEAVLQSEIKKIAEKQIGIIYNNINRIGKKALGQATLFSSLPQVQDAYQLALTGNIYDENDARLLKARNELRKFIKPILKAHKRDTGSEQFKLHFHLPSNRSFLRVWRDGWQTRRDGKKLDISDDLSSFRAMVVEINKGDHRTLKGIEVGRGGFVIRGIVPIAAPDGTHLGSNEVFFGFDNLLRMTKAHKEINYAVYLDKNLLPVATKLQDISKFPVLGNKYVFTASTNRKLTSSLVASDLLDQGKDHAFSKFSDDYYLTSFPIQDYSGKTVGVMAMVQDISLQKAVIAQIRGNGKKSMTQLRYKVIIGAVVSALGILALLWFVVDKTILAPLEQSICFASRVATGDFTHILDMNQKDEIGTLAGALNKMVADLSFVFKNISNGSKTLSVMSMDFSTLSSQLSNGAHKTMSQSKHVAISSQNMSDNMDSVAAACQQTDNNVNMIAVATHGMITAIDKITQNTKIAHEITIKAVGHTQNSSEKIEKLGDAARKIGRVAESITEISEQTNLLALNATIEAARAGEAGKGFTVVAKEIKDLAGQTAEATFEIKESIAEVRKSTRETISEINETAKVISETNKIVSFIATAMEECSSTTREISSNVNQASDGISEMNKNVINTSTLSDEVATDIVEITKNTKAINGIMGHIQFNIVELEDLAGHLKTTNKQFNFGEERFPIEQIKKAYLDWSKNLMEAIGGEITLNLEKMTDHKKCVFGTWYSGEQGGLMASHPVYEKLGKQHERVHELCRKIAVMIDKKKGSSDIAEAMERFASERVALFKSLDELYLS